jgi:hypothetical protein
LGISGEVVVQPKQRFTGILLQTGELDGAEDLYAEVEKAITREADQFPIASPTWNLSNAVQRDTGRTGEDKP